MISVTILAKNSEETIEETLLSTISFDEVVLLDTGSTDKTCSIAKKFKNVRTEQSDFLGFGPTHNLATSLAKNNWILSLDSDEILSDELIDELKNLKLNPDCLYEFKRENYLFGKKMTSCSGWTNDYIIRLYHREKASFTTDAVHERIIGKNLKIVRLKNPIFHTPYRKMEDFLSKMQSYSTLFANQHKGKKSSSFTKALFRGFYAFIKSYIFKRGIFGGKRGFIISFYNAETTFYKYLKLAYANKTLR